MANHEESLLSKDGEITAGENYQNMDSFINIQSKKFGIVNNHTEENHEIKSIELQNVANVSSTIIDPHTISPVFNTTLQSSDISSSPELGNQLNSLLINNRYPTNQEMMQNQSPLTEVKKPQSPFDIIFNPPLRSIAKSNSNWVVFDENNETQNNCNGGEHPETNVFQNETSPNNENLLNLSTSLTKPCSNSSSLLLFESDKNCVSNLSDTVNANISYAPPIPERVLTPQLSHTNIQHTPSSTQSCFISNLDQLYSSSNNQQLSNNINRLLLTPPLIPPRKEVVSITNDFSLITTQTVRAETTPSDQWITFDETDGLQQTPAIDKVEALKNEPDLNDSVEENYLDLVSDHSNYFPTQTNDSMSSSMKEKSSVEEDSNWLTPSSSIKRLRKGYQHLNDESDDEKQMEKPLESSEVVIEVTDLSPTKQQSTWVPIQNDIDDMDGSSGNVSAHNSLDEHEEHDDLDDFNADRLSANITDLKGFNRVDKGSQNNLVDFSGSADNLDGAECRNHSNEDLEIIFDMSAQGDTLKKRRKVKSEGDAQRETSEADAVFFVAPKDADAGSNLAPTNPFWSPPPQGETASLASTASDNNPFDMINLQGSSATSEITTPKTKILFPSIPPPPSTTRVRISSGSTRRGRRSLVSSPLVSDNDELSQIRSITQVEDLPSSFLSGNESDQVFFETSQLGDSLIDNLNGSLNFNANNTSVTYTAAGGGNVTFPITFNDDSDFFENFGIPAEKENTRSSENFENFSLRGFSDVVAPSLDDAKIEECLEVQRDNVNLVESAVEINTELQNELLVENESINEKKAILDDVDLPVLEWSMLMRFPREKKVMSTRKWVPIFVRLNIEKTKHPSLQLFHNSTSTEPYYVIALSGHDWQVTEPTLQPRFYNTDSLNDMEPEHMKRKVHTVKVLHVRYKEKLAYMSKKNEVMMKSPFGFKHSMKGKQAVKLGTESYSHFVSFLNALHNASFNANRLSCDTVKSEEAEEHYPIVKFHSRDEIIFNVKDKLTGSVSTNGDVKAKVEVNVFVTSFLSGDPMATVTFNDIKVEGREVVSREDILPSSNESWIEINDVAVHKCSTRRGYDKQSASVTFHPPDACKFELLRFNCNYSEPQFPVSVKASANVKGVQITLRCVVRSSSSHSANKDLLSQVPCEDLSIRFSIPERWVPAFRKTGRIRIKSVHAKRTTRVPSTQGDNVVLGSNATLEASVGDAKYEAAYKSLVWRMPRFPEKNAAQNTPQVFTCFIELNSDRDLPELSELQASLGSCEVEYMMPSTTASSVCVRSVNLPNAHRAEKFVCYSAHYFYKVGISLTHDLTPDQSS